jgi:hypothetical protein
MSNILKTLVIVAALVTAGSAANADAFTPHGVWDAIDGGK